MPFIGSKVLAGILSYLAGGSGSSYVGFTQAGTGAVTRTVQEKLREVELNISDYMSAAQKADVAAGTLLVDCSDAVKATLEYAFSNSDLKQNFTVTFPYGNMLITEDNVLGQWTANSSQAAQFVTFRGKGQWASRITFRPTGNTDKWLYNGETDGGGVGRPQQLMMAYFEGLGFICDDVNMTGGSVNLFKQFPLTGVPNQNFSFNRCWFQFGGTYPGRVLQIKGTFNGSENHFHDCRSRFAKHVIECFNAQAVNQNITSCDWELMLGDCYKFNAGGYLTHVGGSVIMGNGTPYTEWATGQAIVIGDQRLRDGNLYTAASNGNTGATPPVHTVGTVSDGAVDWTFTENKSVYFLNFPQQFASADFTFIGIKWELPGSTSKIIRAGAADITARVKFLNCSISSAAGTNAYGNRIELLPRARTKVLIEGGNWSATPGVVAAKFLDDGTNTFLSFRYLSEIRTLNVYGIFTPALVTYGTNAQGCLFSVRQSYDGAAAVAGQTGNIYDCDFTNVGGFGARASGGDRLKAAQGYIQNWPNPTFPVTTQGNRITLPVQAMLKSIRVRKASGGTASASNYQLAVTNGDGSYTYGLSNIVRQDGQHDIDVTGIWRLLNDNSVNQEIRVESTKVLDYNTQTANFTVGATLTDGTTGTTAKILADSDSGATGTLTIGYIAGGTGAFGVGNLITDTGGGSATAGATTSYQGLGIPKQPTAGDIFVVEYF